MNWVQPERMKDLVKISERERSLSTPEKRVVRVGSEM